MGGYRDVIGLPLRLSPKQFDNLADVSNSLKHSAEERKRYFAWLEGSRRVDAIA